jgi:hypothetical protein
MENNARNANDLVTYVVNPEVSHGSRLILSWEVVVVGGRHVCCRNSGRFLWTRLSMLSEDEAQKFTIRDFLRAT